MSPQTSVQLVTAPVACNEQSATIRSPLQPISNAALQQLNTTPSRKEFERQQVSPIDKYLTIPKTKAKLPTAPSQTRAITGARVLTSAECLSVIREKELKKKQQEEEKENRKKIREEKKQQREEEKKQKAEERKRKQEEKIRKANEKEMLKVQKAEERKQKAKEKRQAQARKETGRNIGETTTSGTRVQLRARQPQKSAPTPPILSNRCCVCDQTYEEDMELGGGVEWVQCSCQRWLHEDCVLESSTDYNGKETLCPFC